MQPTVLGHVQVGHHSHQRLQKEDIHRSALFEIKLRYINGVLFVVGVGTVRLEYIRLVRSSHVVPQGDEVVRYVHPDRPGQNVCVAHPRLLSFCSLPLEFGSIHCGLVVASALGHLLWSALRFS